MPGLPVLTSLRFFAAFGIMAHHTVNFHQFQISSGLHYLVSCGVSFFFVLSGFVLTWNYYEMEPWEIRNFYIKRIARIYPAHWLVMLLYVFFLSAFVVYNWRTDYGLIGVPILAANLALLQSWVPVCFWYFSFNAPAWSVSCEVFFYLCFPLLVILLRRHWFLVALATFAFVPVLIWLANPLPAMAVQTEMAWHIDQNGLVQFSPISRIAEFGLGMICAHFARRRYLARSGFGSYSTSSCALEIASYITIWVFTMLHGGADLLLYLTNSKSMPALSLWLKQSGPSFAFILLLYAVHSPNSITSRLMRARALFILGEASYALYLIHVPFRIFLELHNPWLADMPDRLIVALYLVGAVSLSLLIWSLAENPARHFIISITRKYVYLNKSPESDLLPSVK